MKKKKNSNKKKLDKRSKRKKEKLDGLIGVDMCACFPMFAGRCEGICRSVHTHKKVIECGCLYRVKDTDEYIALNKKGKKSRHKEADDFSDKDNRRERLKFKSENRKYE